MRDPNCSQSYKAYGCDDFGVNFVPYQNCCLGRFFVEYNSTHRAIMFADVREMYVVLFEC